MPRVEGRYGLAYTADKPESAARFDDLVSAYLGFGRDIGDRLKAILTDDPEMPLAHVAKGYLFKLFGSAAMSVRAAKALADADARFAAVATTDRERLHLEALRAWCADDLDRTTELWERILIDHPKDAFALRLAHFNHFYAGEGRKMRDSVARVLPDWSDADPDIGFVHGMYGFALEEAGDYAAGERYGRMAVERNPKDAWSVHAVAHVMEMQGRHAEGIEWVRGLEPAWSTTNNFRFHLYWHRGLYHLERHEFDEVLKLYDDHVASDIASDMYLDVCNAASMLWRLEMYGVDVGGRWRDLTEVSLRHVDDHELIFVSLHYLMALLKGGEAEAASRMAAQLESFANSAATQGRVSARVGVGTAAAMTALARGDAGAAVDALLPIRYDIWCMGGSHAQRDLFEEMLVSAAVKARPHLARALLAERTASKPASAWSWRQYAAALRSEGRDEAAASADKRAEALLAAV
jgi:tetratricopeptide (TPR) repeat protein